MEHRSRKATVAVIWIGSLLFLILGILLYSNLREPRSNALEQAKQEQELARTVLQNAPTRGAQNPSIILVEFGDFECPYCRDLSPLIEKIIEEYPEDVRHVWVHTPNLSTHPEALQAAVASFCANQQGRFWTFHDQLFANQASLSTALYNQIASTIKLDLSRFQACLGNEEAREIVAKNLEFSSSQGVDATPYLLVNQESISGAVTYEELRAVIERQRQP